METKFPQKIKRFILDGVFNGDEVGDTDDLLDMCGRRLSKAYAQDILETVIFEAKDGKFYTVQVLGIIEEISPENILEIYEIEV